MSVVIRRITSTDGFVEMRATELIIDGENVRGMIHLQVEADDDSAAVGEMLEDLALALGRPAFREEVEMSTEDLLARYTEE